MSWRMLMLQRVLYVPPPAVCGSRQTPAPGTKASGLASASARPAPQARCWFRSAAPPASVQHVKGTLEEMRAPADVSAHAVHVIQSTLPQFHFPPDDDDQGGSQQAGGAAPLAAQLRVLPGGDAVALRLMQSGASSSPGDAAAQAAAPAPPGFPSKPATEPTGSAGAGRQGAFPSGEQCLAVGLPADSGKGGGPAAAAHSAGEPPAEAAGQPVSLAAAAAPAGGAAGSAAAAQPARRRPHLDWVPADLADMLASEDPSVRMGALFILPEPRSPRGCGGSRTRQQLVQLARERWAMLSAGLLAGPGLLAGVAVWAAAAALVGAHLMAALASPGPPGPRQ